MTVQILGINFFNGEVEDLFNSLNDVGGLMTVPAAPALVTITRDSEYYKALLESNIVIPDSGYMVLIWNIFFKKKIKKISGLEFINFFVENIKSFEKDKFFLVNPSDEDGNLNKDFLSGKGLNIANEDIYTAPFYNGKVDDVELLKLIEERKPKWVFVNIGGGTQEKLGLYLKNNLSYSPAILCTGAAIAFKTGRQANIPSWVDKIYMGWLSRCFSNPKVFVPRYLKGFALLRLILQNGSKNLNLN